MDLTPAIYEWEVLGPDVTPPTTLITGGPPEGSSTPNFISIFTFSGIDDFTPALELDFECTLDGANIGGCDPLAEEIEVTTPGPHTLVVQAIDAAGNIDPVGATRNWTVIDMSGPDTEVLTGPEEETTETSATFTFEGFELLDGDARHPVRVRARPGRVRRRARAACPARRPTRVWPAAPTSSTSARSIPTATATSRPRSTSG